MLNVNRKPGDREYFVANHRLFWPKRGLAKAGKQSEPDETAAEDKAWLKLKWRETSEWALERASRRQEEVA